MSPEALGTHHENVAGIPADNERGDPAGRW